MRRWRRIYCGNRIFDFWGKLGKIYYANFNNMKIGQKSPKINDFYPIFGALSGTRRSK